MDEPGKKLKLHITQSVIVLFTVMAIIGTLFCASAFAGASNDEESVESEMSTNKADVMKYGLIAAAVALALAPLAPGLRFLMLAPQPWVLSLKNLRLQARP